jgi:hypothetical protein
MLYVLKNHIPLVLHEDDDEEVRMKYECHIDDDDEQATCVIFDGKLLKFQIQHRYMDVYIIIRHLKELFDATSKIEMYEPLKHYSTIR